MRRPALSSLFLAISLPVALACAGDGAGSTDSLRGAADTAGTTTDSASGTVAADGPGRASDVGPGGGREANPMGRIPVLEYHLIGDKDSEWMVERGRFRENLKTLYARGYRPITVAQMIDKDFSAVPSGMSPIVFTFDDASPSQFSYIERNGQLEVDPNSVVGIWTDFVKNNAGWTNRATFCLLPGAGNGHAFFGDNVKWSGQKKEWRHQKVKWLADNGFELCNHTLWHAQLSKYPDAVVQEQIARGQLAIDSAVPGYKVRTFAFPQGLWPKNRALAWKGSWTDPKSGKTTTYNHDTVLEVSGGPSRSPNDPKFERNRLNRFIVNHGALEKMLDRLESATDATERRFVVP